MPLLHHDAVELQRVLPRFVGELHRELLLLGIITGIASVASIAESRSTSDGLAEQAYRPFGAGVRSIVSSSKDIPAYSMVINLLNVAQRRPDGNGRRVPPAVAIGINLIANAVTLPQFQVLG